MRNPHDRTISLFNQVAIEVKLFWRSRQAVYLTFLVPMLGMALLVYLGKEGMLERFFDLVIRGLGGGKAASMGTSPMAFLTVGLIAYTVIDVAFESLVPAVVRQRDLGILKRLGGTPLRGWVFLAAKTLNVSMLVLAEVALIFAMGLVSSEIMVAGNWLLLGGILLLGISTFTSMGFVLGSLIASTDAAVAAVHAIYIPMILLCGAFVPVQALPKALQAVAKALPLTYFVAPFRSVMVEGTGLAANRRDLLILLAWMIAGWIVAIKTFRWE